jgi:hypothetical protein
MAIYASKIVFLTAFCVFLSDFIYELRAFRCRPIVSAVPRVLCMAALRTSAAAVLEASGELTSPPTRHAFAATGTNDAIPTTNIALKHAENRRKEELFDFD